MEKRHVNKWVEITGQIPSSFLIWNTSQKNRTFIQKKGEGEKEERDDLNAKKKKKSGGFFRSVILELGYILWAPLKKMEQCFNIGFDRNLSVDFLHSQEKKEKKYMIISINTEKTCQYPIMKF